MRAWARALADSRPHYEIGTQDRRGPPAGPPAPSSAASAAAALTLLPKRRQRAMAGTAGPGHRRERSLRGCVASMSR